MDWDAIGAIAELLGAVAVIVSILYLAAQVRQSAADVRAEIIHSLHNNQVDLVSKPAVDTVLALGVEKAHIGEPLNREERAQYSMWVLAHLINHQQIKMEYDRLDVDPDLYASERIRLAGMMQTRLAQAVYYKMRDRFTPDYQTYVEQTFVRDRKDEI